MVVSGVIVVSGIIVVSGVIVASAEGSTPGVTSPGVAIGVTMGTTFESTSGFMPYFCIGWRMTSIKDRSAAASADLISLIVEEVSLLLSPTRKLCRVKEPFSFSVLIRSA